MDSTEPSERPLSRRGPSSPSCSTAVGAKGQTAQSAQPPKEKISPFHRSPIVRGDVVISSKRPVAASGRLLASPGSLFRDFSGHLTAATAAAGISVEYPNRSGFLLATTGAKSQVSLIIVTIN